MLFKKKGIRISCFEDGMRGSEYWKAARKERESPIIFLSLTTLHKNKGSALCCETLLSNSTTIVKWGCLFVVFWFFWWLRLSSGSPFDYLITNSLLRIILKGTFPSLPFFPPLHLPTEASPAPWNLLSTPRYLWSWMEKKQNNIVQLPYPICTQKDGCKWMKKSLGF